MLNHALLKISFFSTYDFARHIAITYKMSTHQLSFSVSNLRQLRFYDDAMTSKCFPHHWPVVWGTMTS